MNKEELSKLYYSEGKTLQQIGDIFNLTKERIRQLMESFNLPRYTKRGWPLGKAQPKHSKFNTLNDYFTFVKSGGKESKITLWKFISPFKKQCTECPSTKNLHIHHLQYPAKSLKDIQILCASCHVYKHGSGNGHKKQLEICDKYIKGKSGSKLGKEFNVSAQAIYNILHKWDIQVRQYKYKSRKNRVIKKGKTVNIIRLPAPLTCKRCSYSWIPRKIDVKVCSRCKSPYWNKDYSRKRKSSGPGKTITSHFPQIRNSDE